MKRIKDQRDRRRSVIRRTLREHFAGAGAGPRRMAFVHDVLLSSAAWTAKLLCMVSWAVVGGLLAGPQHEVILREFHAWVVARPIEQLLAEGHTWFLRGLTYCVAMGLILGLARVVGSITDPALEQAEVALVSPGA